MSETQTDIDDLIARRVDDWRRRLIDLSHRNRLIAYKPTQATTLTVVAPSLDELLANLESGDPWDFYLPPEPEVDESDEPSEAASTVDELLVRSQDRQRRRRPNEIEVSETNPKKIARVLDNLAKRSNNEFQDKALRILYIAAGFLDWHDAQRDKPISSPLVLVPVELRRESTRDPYRLFFVDDEEIVINPSLTEKLRRDAGLDVPDDWQWEDKPIGQELNEIREAISKTGWTVREDAAISLFSFQKYVMYRDLLDHEEQVSAHPVVRSLAQGRLEDALRQSDPDVPELSDLDEAQPPEDTLSILDADASQRQCVEAAKRGRSFVMQGPPGTGKSQTIANVIAEAIGQGKRILFVSEKAAALDVVFKRLAVSGLDEYCLMLHGEHAGRREVVQVLDRSLTSALKPGVGMRADELDRLKNLRLLLNDSAELLHLPAPLLGDRTLREVHEELAELHGAPSVPGAPSASTATGPAVLDEYQRLSEVFHRLAERWHVSPDDFVWRGYDGERFTADDHGRALTILRELRHSADRLKSTGQGVAEAIGAPVPGSFADARDLGGLSEHLERAPELESHWLDLAAARLETIAQEADDAYQRLDHAAGEFRSAFPARSVEDFDAQLDTTLQHARDEVQRRCGWSESWETDLALLPAALRALDRLPALIATAREKATSAARLLGQPETAWPPERLEDLARLAELAFGAEHRPEREWLVRAGLARAQDVIKAVSDDLIAFQSQRAELLTRYTAEALDLDAAAIAERFATQYTSMFSKLSGAYRQDIKAIKAVVRGESKVPATLQDDLLRLAKAREIGERIDAQDRRLSAALGSYAAQRDTDPEAVRSALATAQLAMNLSAPDADLDVLGDAVAVGASSSPALAQAADQLRDAVRALHEELPSLSTFVVSKRDLLVSDLDELDRVVDESRGPIQELAALVADLDTGARSPAETWSATAERARIITDLHQARALVESSQDDWRSMIGGGFAAQDTDFAEVRSAAAWLAYFEAPGAPALTPQIREQLVLKARSWPKFNEHRDAVEQMRSVVEQLTGLFDPERAVSLREQCTGAAFADVTSLSDDLLGQVDELGDWVEWRAWRQRAHEEGWGEFVEALISASVDDSAVVAAFQRAYWHRRLEALYDDDPDFAADLRGGALQRWIDEFRQLDRKLVRTGADRLIARRERARVAHVSTPGSEIGLLRREALKKRRHLPVRILLSRIPTLLSELKPCLMMSPLTVSHFLAADHTFDLVVFDEASQVPPQDAINCIYRGKQLVVAGDSKQLPPTPFFQITELDEPNVDDETVSTQEDMESVLDACDALLPGHALRWHYRSRAEPLIAFSNRHIYAGGLMTFPSVHERSDRLGVSFVHVPDGVYDRGRTASNRREAQVVARRVMDHLLDGTHRSVGVIAFNTAQATAISEELDLLKIQHPELEQHFRGDRLDDVFVKHLEAVQGDERDVIIFSVGYGRDAEGKFSTNFGPLNKDGGQRRLNVAVTRAREQVELVASVRSHDFQLSEGASAGARMLRDYISYAEAGGRFASPGVEDEAEPWPTPLEEQVALAIDKIGYEAVPSVGVGSFRLDLGVRARDGSQKFLLGIECDGGDYASTPTARDRERLRHEVLAQLGWGPIYRISSLDWVRNRAAEITRLGDALAAAEAAAAQDATSREAAGDGGQSSDTAPADVEQPRERVERVIHELGSAGAAAALPWTQTYERAVIKRYYASYEFHESPSRRVQTDMLVELLAVEAPVSIDYAIRRLAEAWGLQRAGHRVVSAGRQAVSQAVRRGAAQVRGEFVWRPDQTLTVVRVPDPDDPTTRREIDEIAPEELDLAIARLREASAGLDDETLITQVARLFGFDRTGGRIRAALGNRVAQRRN